MRDCEKCCGTCEWHRNVDGEWVCTNAGSEYNADWTGYEDCCEEWEGW